jgi:hypothetical protein
MMPHECDDSVYVLSPAMALRYVQALDFATAAEMPAVRRVIVQAAALRGA